MVSLISIRPTKTGNADPLSLTIKRSWWSTSSDNTVTTTPRTERKNVFESWITLPVIMSRPVLQSQRLARELLAWTDWTHDKLAKVLKVSHTTVLALENGVLPTERGADLSDRLVEVHTIVRRVHLIADQDPSRTSDLLSASSANGSNAETLLAQRKPADAYLAVLDAQRPRRVEPMMQSIWPAKPGNATHDLAEDLL